MKDDWPLSRIIPMVKTWSIIILVSLTIIFSTLLLRRQCQTIIDIKPTIKTILIIVFSIAVIILGILLAKKCK